MKIYSLYNSRIASEIELYGKLTNSKNEIDFQIKETAKSPINTDFKWYKKIYYKKKLWSSYAKNNYKYGIRFHAAADFSVNIKNKEIIYYKRKSTGIDTLRHLLADQVIPLALSLQNKILFHSSTVQVGKYAVSFQASSGFGKSTIAAYFSTKNHQLITDDSLLLEEIENKIYAYPSYPGIRLYPDNLENIFNTQFETKKVSQFNTKRLLESNLDFVKSGEPPPQLKSIYFIKNTNHTDIEPIKPSEAFSLIIKKIFRLDIKSKTINKFQFEFISKVLNNVELYRLNYEKKYENLEKVYNLVVENTLKETQR